MTGPCGCTRPAGRMPIPASSPAQFLPTAPEPRPDRNPSEPIDRVPVSNAGLARVWVRACDTVPTRVLEVAEDHTARWRAGSPRQAEPPVNRRPRSPANSCWMPMRRTARTRWPMRSSNRARTSCWAVGCAPPLPTRGCNGRSTASGTTRRTVWTCGSTRSRPNSRCLANSSCAPSRTRPPDAW